ncbi:peptidase M20 [Halioglobus japonicus]|uniref:Amidohydrolase n=1 Tax=Halioglobus japonicus TaxID=930805 RepID=A0AAP8SMC0_9GAMM|nr:amidohydrolase [Halioglobus japonicus]AQA17455.1 peptidase M20 [Halioglobus japonicus]PLW85379.1 amidohydrolase [Halioglobus japonicus]GHD22029.1 putative amidohydrolase [Halioglobus japonicus]
MQNIYKLLGALVLGSALPLQAAPLDNAALVAHYQHLHRNPELSLQEEQTAAYLAAELKRMGYAISTGIGGHGIVALLENGEGPTLMFRADMDGLPIPEATGLPYASQATGVIPSGDEVPVMHGCGHDVHMTVLLGVASQLAERRDEWQGTLMLVGQPAEEVGKGAKAMLEDGLFERFPLPEVNLALHVSAGLPAGKIAWVSGYAMANVDSVDVSVYGQGGHGAYPHKTKDPVVMAAQIVTTLQTIISREISPLDSAVITVGSIHGGTKHNIISDEVKLQLTVRSYSDESRAYLLRRIEEISQGVARTAGMPEDRLPLVEVKDEYTPAVYNNPELVAQVVPLLEQSLGADAVIKTSPVMGGEDFARYGRTEHAIPGSLMWLGAVKPADYAASERGELSLPSLHSAKFAPDAAPAIDTGVQAVTDTLLGLFKP